MSLSSRTSFLLFLSSIGKINPAALDAIIPHGPVLSVGARDVMASMIIKAIAPEVRDAKITQELNGLGKKLFTTGAKAMSYDDDDWCGTLWPHRFGPDPLPWTLHPGVLVDFNPQPDPPGIHYYGALLVLLADAVSVKEIGASLKKAGNFLLEKNLHKAAVKAQAK